MRAIFKNCSGLQKKYRRSSCVHRVLLKKKNREEEAGENQRERNRKAQLKKDLMLAGGTRAYKNLTVLQGYLGVKESHLMRLQILNLNLPKRPRFVNL
ncbi:unnamed protein product [Rhizophagus irregularis]|nr:unnamed protein product [Rhizophagus irregularis]